MTKGPPDILRNNGEKRPNISMSTIIGVLLIELAVSMSVQEVELA